MPQWLGWKTCFKIAYLRSIMGCFQTVLIRCLDFYPIRNCLKVAEKRITSFYYGFTANSMYFWLQLLFRIWDFEIVAWLKKKARNIKGEQYLRLANLPFGSSKGWSGIPTESVVTSLYSLFLPRSTCLFYSEFVVYALRVMRSFAGIKKNYCSESSTTIEQF